jgi:hypothetical protein
MNDQPISIDEALKEIARGTFLDGFEETRGTHPLPPEVAEVLSGQRKDPKTKK